MMTYGWGQAGISYRFGNGPPTRGWITSGGASGQSGRWHATTNCWTSCPPYTLLQRYDILLWVLWPLEKLLNIIHLWIHMANFRLFLVWFTRHKSHKRKKEILPCTYFEKLMQKFEGNSTMYFEKCNFKNVRKFNYILPKIVFWQFFFTIK